LPPTIWAVLTFTRNAASEMRQRIREMLRAVRSQRECQNAPTTPPPGVGSEADPPVPRVQTYHAFCMRLLRRHLHRLEDSGFTRSFTLYEDKACQAVMADVVERLEMIPLLNERELAAMPERDATKKRKERAKEGEVAGASLGTRPQEPWGAEGLGTLVVTVKKAAKGLLKAVQRVKPKCTLADDAGVRIAEAPEALYQTYNQVGRAQVREGVLHWLSLIRETYHGLPKVLRERNAMDFADLIHWSLQLLVSHGGVARWTRSDYPYVLVDEFQDTSMVQLQARP
jgi:superfamily I DNA/RNA helicase